MQPVEELSQQIEVLRERLSKLSAASLRVNESLDYEAVLQGVLDSACSLTGARYGVVVVLDAAGRRLAFCSGLTAEQSRRLLAMEGRPFLEYLAASPGQMRLRDLFDYLRSRGLPEWQIPMPVPSKLPFMAAPARHRGETVAHFYLSDKEQADEFSAEDEEILMMFASQAALVIANARRYRDEQRARADLEALVNTAPVGVVVIDASSGLPVSVNAEARRIVGDLLEPGRPLQRLYESLTVLRADGRAIPLGAFPVAEALGAGKTLQAEEIILKVGDGRSVTTLVNATPIHSEAGDVESYLVTLQDMTPMEELERLRAEFLGMVSHELRTPLTSIIGCASTLMDSSPSLDPTEMAQFHRIIHQQAESMRDLIGELLDVARIEAGELSVFPVPVEAASLVDEARNTFMSGGGRDNIHIDVPPDLPLVLADRRRIVQVLGNLLSNAARVSPESSAIAVTAAREDGHVAFCVVDEGRGYLRSGCRTCSGSTPAWRVRTADTASRAQEWDWPSARGSWRPTGAGFGPTATGPGWDPGSPSPSPRPRTLQPPSPLWPAAPGSWKPHAPPSWWSMTTRRRSETCATRCRKPATRRSWPPTPSRPAPCLSSGSRTWSCST